MARVSQFTDLKGRKYKLYLPKLSTYSDLLHYSSYVCKLLEKGIIKPDTAQSIVMILKEIRETLSAQALDSELVRKAEEIVDK